VQIRTFEMHQHSEYGVAAHWRYKESGRSGPSRSQKPRRQVRRQDRVAAPDPRLEEGCGRSRRVARAVQDQLFEDTIYVFTPQGKVIDLPKGATPVDFAYQIHSGLGHRCRGAKVNGVMVPLNTPLANGQRSR
jgi:GTP pyrophosphokinase